MTGKATMMITKF